MGRVVVHLHGRAKDASFRASISDYANRLSSSGVTLVEHRNQKQPAPYLKEIVEKNPDDDIILLEEDGEQLNSLQYAERLKQWTLSRRDTLGCGPTRRLWTIERPTYFHLTGDDHVAT